MRYNMDGSHIFDVASKLKILADGKFEPILPMDGGADAPKELTFEMKHQLNTNANLLSSKDLYGMVGIVEDNCKRALDQVTHPS